MTLSGRWRFTALQVRIVRNGKGETSWQIPKILKLYPIWVRPFPHHSRTGGGSRSPAPPSCLSLHLPSASAGRRFPTALGTGTATEAPIAAVTSQPVATLRPPARLLPLHNRPPRRSRRGGHAGGYTSDATGCRHAAASLPTPPPTRVCDVPLNPQFAALFNPGCSYAPPRDLHCLGGV